MSRKKDKIEICRWCGKEIVEGELRLYTALPLDAPRYYCAKDPNADRCAHMPGGSR